MCKESRKKYTCACGFEGWSLKEMIGHVEQEIKENPVPANHSFAPEKDAKQELKH